MLFDLCRNTSRAIIVKFEKLDNVLYGEEKAKKLMDLRKAQNRCSSLIGKMIHYSATIYTPESFEAMSQTVAVNVANSLGHCLPRLTDTYQIWLYTMLKVCMQNKFVIVSVYHVYVGVMFAFLILCELVHIQLGEIIDIDKADISDYFQLTQTKTIEEFQSSEMETIMPPVYEACSSVLSSFLTEVIKYLKKFPTKVCMQP